MSRMNDDPGMWETVQLAIADGWQATARLCIFVLIRYGPRVGLGAATLQALEVIGHHHGV
jgi:hypothetical protein